MEDVAIKESNGGGDHDEEMMFLNDVVQDDHELYFLHTYLHESFGAGGASSISEEEETL